MMNSLETNKIYHSDCIPWMKELPTRSIDMILCDLPYGTTACAWDQVIPFEKLWEQYERIIKDNGAIVLTASQPFTSLLVTSNLKLFKYEWIYQKVVGSNFATAKYMPMKEHENVLVFGKGKTKYNPIMQERSESGKKRLETPYHTNSETSLETMGNIARTNAGKEYDKEMRYPSSVQKFNNRAVGARGFHPTGKPIELFEYLIRTYTDEGDLVMDNCIGGGTTAIAAIRTNRRFIGCELNKDYYDIAVKRIETEGSDNGENKQSSMFD